MKVTVEDSYYDDQYSVNVENITKEKAKEIVNTLAFPVPAILAQPYVLLKDLSYSRIEGYTNALKYYTVSNEHGYDNKIMQIKFLRSISDLGLKDAKDFVEYILHGADRPEMARSY